jgi:hypothetical protein
MLEYYYKMESSESVSMTNSSSLSSIKSGEHTSNMPLENAIKATATTTTTNEKSTYFYTKVILFL